MIIGVHLVSSEKKPTVAITDAAIVAIALVYNESVVPSGIQ